MKTPRVHDFDPDAKLPELGSPMDHLPAIRKPAVKPLSPPAPLSPADHQEQTSSTYGEPPVRTNARTPVRRQLTRYAFEFYQDQVEELRHLSLEEKMQGGKGSMSEMVREAIDAYLTQKKRTGE
jgi:hypothetical protein